MTVSEGLSRHGVRDSQTICSVTLLLLLLLFVVRSSLARCPPTRHVMPVTDVSETGARRLEYTSNLSPTNRNVSRRWLGRKLAASTAANSLQRYNSPGRRDPSIAVPFLTRPTQPPILNAKLTTSFYAETPHSVTEKCHVGGHVKLHTKRKK